VVVVGAGLAGLTAGRLLAEVGARVTVLEADAIVGGRMATSTHVDVDHGGRTTRLPVEHGVHGVFAPYRNLNGLLDRWGLSRELGEVLDHEVIFALPDRPMRHISVGQRIRSSRLPAPLCTSRPFMQRAFMEATGLDLRGHLQSLPGMLHMLAYDPIRDEPSHDRMTLADLVRGWPAGLVTLFTALSRSGTFTEPHRVSLAAFLAGTQLYVLADKEATAFRSFTRDAETALFAPLRRVIEEAGGEVRTRSPVTRVLLEGGRATGVLLDDGTRLGADAVLLAVDPVGFETLRGGDLAALFDGCVVPRGLSSVSVRLFYAAPPPVDRAQTAILAGTTADALFWLHRVLTPYAAWTRATGGAALELHLYADNADRAGEQSDEQLIQCTGGLVERLFPSLAGHRLQGQVQRNPPRHTELGPGTGAGAPEVSGQVPGLALCGDWIRPPWPCFNLERATVTAVLAARALASQLGLHTERLPAPLPSAPPARLVRLASRGCRLAFTSTGRWPAGPQV